MGPGVGLGVGGGAFVDILPLFATSTVARLRHLAQRDA